MLLHTSETTPDYLAGTTVLLVEDDPAIEQIMRRALGAHGCGLISATTAAEARAALDAVTPDLIILDLVLPDADGLVLTATLTAPNAPPILVCSARDRLVDRVLALKLGAADFIGKPFDLDEL